jgi:hypothetical protein
MARLDLRRRRTEQIFGEGSVMICPLNNRECRCNPADEKRRPCALARRIGQLIRLQASPIEGEAFNATGALRRMLPAEGLDFSDIAVLVENCDGRIETLQFSEDDVAGSFARGVERGRAEGRGRGLSVDYFDDDGEPRWLDMAKFCQNNPAATSLKPSEQEFIEEMLVKLRWRTPTRAMGGFLLSIFWKLRGSL